MPASSSAEFLFFSEMEGADDPVQFHVLDFVATEAISEMYRVELTVAHEDPELDLNLRLMGKLFLKLELELQLEAVPGAVSKVGSRTRITRLDEYSSLLVLGHEYSRNGKRFH